jgi:hypothetical protein
VVYRQALTLQQIEGDFMASLISITTIQAPTTKSAAFQGAGVDVSGITGDWTLKIRVTKLTAGKNARFQFTDSTDNFSTDKVAGRTLSFAGEISPAADVTRSVQKYDFPQLRMGVASAKLRLEITAIDAGGSVDYTAWIESA